MTFDQTPVSERERRSSVSHTKLVAGSCGVVLLIVLIGAGVWWWAIRGEEDKVANVEMAEEVTRSYVKALHNGEVGSAYRLLAEEVRSRQSQEEYASFVKAAPNSGVIEKYEGLEICEYQFGDKGLVTAIGLLHYEGGDIYFASNLVEGSDKTWGIYKFYTDSEVEPKPWAGCLYEGQSAASPLTVAGTVQSVSLSAKVVFLSEPTMSIETIAITEQTELADSQGNPIILREIQPGQSIQAAGKLHENSLLATQITVTSQEE